MLDTSHFFIFFFCFCALSILFAMLIPLHLPKSKEKPKVAKKKAKSFCPLCIHPLQQGEKIHSDQTEIGNTQIETRLKGCIYCIYKENKLPRSCPICKKDVSHDDYVLATSDLKIDRLKLNIKGCRLCFPQGFIQ